MPNNPITASVHSWEAQASGNFVRGKVFGLDGAPQNGYGVVFSGVGPDQDWACENYDLTGPHEGYPDWQAGYYSTILHIPSPLEVRFWLWLVDPATGSRLSDVAILDNTLPELRGLSQCVCDWFVKPTDPPPVPPATSTHFSQRDPRWSLDILGTSPTLTIGTAGCLISAIAGVLVDWGVSTDPGRLNAWLRSHDGYLNGDLLLLKAPAGLGADLVQVIRCRTTPAPLGAINDHLAAGRAVIAQVNAHPGHPHAPHWLRLLAPETAPDDRTDIIPAPLRDIIPAPLRDIIPAPLRDYHGSDPWRDFNPQSTIRNPQLLRDYHASDPWRDPGDELTSLLHEYALPGWDAARVITGAVVYEHSPARVLPVNHTLDGPAQDPPALLRHIGYGIYTPLGSVTPMVQKTLEE